MTLAKFLRNSSVTNRECKPRGFINRFFFEVYFEGGTPKMYTNQLKDDCNGVHFFDEIAG